MRRTLFTLPIAASILLAACTPDNNITRATQTDTFLQEPSSQVDILWVVDDSRSMESEQLLVADGFTTFTQSLEETNIDFHIGVVTTNMDLSNPDRGVLIGEPSFLTPEDDYIALFQERITVGIEGSDREKGLAAALEALTEPKVSGENDGFLRPDADLSIIFVSDEDDCSDDEALSNEDASACYTQEDKLVPIRDYIEEFRDMKTGDAQVFASGIVGPDVLENCTDTWPGHRYIGLAESLGGVIGSICDGDYSGIMDEMGLAVSGVLSVFQLEHTPIYETLEVSVDEVLVEEDPVNGWQYDETYDTIRFDGDYVPPRGSTISITYEIAG